MCAQTVALFKFGEIWRLKKKKLYPNDKQKQLRLLKCFSEKLST